MIFLYPEYLYLMLIPLIVFIYLVATNQNSFERYYSKEVLKKIRISDGSIGQKGRNIFLFLALILMIFAFARPVLPKGEVNIKSSNIDILLGIDVSKSMLANDLYPNRLDFAKKRAIEMIDSFKKARFGVVAFSSVGFLVSPVSEDLSSVKFLIKNLNTDSINQRGTNLFAPLQEAKDFLKNEKEKILVLFTDGGDAKDFSKEIEFAKKNGIKVFIYGVGTKKGSTIKENGDLLKDKNGDIVVVRLNEKIKELALDTGGAYIEGDYSGKSIKALIKAIKKDAKETIKREKKVKIYKELFYYPLMAALALMLFGFSSMPKEKGFKSAVLVFLLFFGVQDQLKAGVFDFREIKKANDFYQNREFKKSEEVYKKLLKDRKNSPETEYDLANSLYKQKRYKEALDIYKSIKSDNTELRFKKYFNEGNSEAHLKKFDEAIKAYKEALKIKPDDKDAKFNLELIKNLKKRKQKRKNKNKNNKNQNRKNRDKNSGKGKNSKQKSNKNKSSKKNKGQKNSDKNSSQKKKKNSNKNKKQNQKKSQNSKTDKKKKSGKKRDKVAQKVNKKIMSDAEEKKWMRILLNKKSKTLPLKLNTKVHKRDRGDEER